MANSLFPKSSNAAPLPFQASKYFVSNFKA